MKGFIAIGLLLASFSVSPAAVAQDWRAELEKEKAQNARRISAIDNEGAPVASSLRAVTAEIATHNSNPPDQRNAAAVNAYNAQADALNARRNALRSQIQALINEQDRLNARNREIDRKLHCTQLPVACTSHSDCECSNSCADLGTAGRGSMRVCQPRN